jgi:hypothetical protein
VTYPYAAVTVGADKVRVYDLRTHAKAGMRAPGEITDLVLTRDGVATVMAGGQVLRMNTAGAVSTVDPGPAAPGSLATSDDGGHVYWLRNGVAQVATFPAVSRVEIPTRRERHCGRTRTVPHAADAAGWLVFDPARYEFLGCLGSARARVFFEPADDVYAETVASPYAGVVQLAPSPYGAGDHTVLVHDLRKADVWNSYDTGTWISQLELTNRGVAYILEAGAVNIDGQVIGPPELFRMGADNRITALDKGAIAKGSLTLTPHGRRVYWTKDGMPVTRGSGS